MTAVTAANPPPPPPPPPPPRLTSTSSSGRSNPPPAPPSKLLHGPASTLATQHDVDVSKSLAVARKLGASHNGGAFHHHNALCSSFKSDGSKESRDSYRRSRSAGEIGVAPPPSSSSAGAKVIFQRSKSNQTGNIKGGFHKNGHGNRGNSSQVMDVISNLSTPNEEELFEFKKFCSLSLPEFEASSSNIGDTRDRDRNASLSYNKNGVCNNHDFNTSSTSFTPRPVKISQFKDNDQDNTSTSKGSTTTTPAESSKTPIESLPDNVDKKGRCIKHPRVKLFKKKILGGYYEMIRDVCPQCENEALYEIMMRERAKVTKGSRLNRVDKAPNSYCKGSIRARSGSIDSTRFKERNSQFKERERERERKPSRSNERGRDRVRSRSASRRGRSPSSGASDNHNSTPESNSIFDKGKGKLSSFHNRVRSRSRSLSRPRSKNSFHEESLSSSHRDSARESDKSQKIKFDSRSNERGRYRVRSRSASRRGRSPSSGASDNHNSTPESNSIFDKGKGKLSSLHNRVRSRSRSLSRQRSKNSFYEESLSSSHRDSARESDKSQKIKFDKKTGRCKVHPSIILAKKSTFSKGWDMNPGGCPLCNESQVNNDEGKEFRGEISKKKTSANAPLGKSSSKDYCESHQSQSSFNVAMSVDSRSTNRSPHRFRQNSPAHNRQEIVDNNMISSTEDNEPARVSRMPYTTPWGESGWYTGFVNSSGKPHGKGRMRCKTGKSSDGEWVNGYSEEYLENQGKMKRGFGTNVAKWKENDTNGRRATGSSGQMSSEPSSMSQHYPQAGQYQAEYQASGYQGQAEYQGSGYQGQYQQHAYHPTSYGMAPYSQHPQVGAMPSTGGTWSQSPGYRYQSPGGQRHPVPAYHQGYHQS